MRRKANMYRCNVVLFSHSSKGKTNIPPKNMEKQNIKYTSVFPNGTNKNNPSMPNNHAMKLQSRHLTNLKPKLISFMDIF